MKVIIAEKPSVARDIAEVLNVTGTRNGYIEGQDYAITWAFGHLVTLQEPGEYNAGLKRWSLETLPFIPETFRLTLIRNRGVDKQFATIKMLFDKADEIICATDAGREGELIFRYILQFSDCETKPIRRLWLNSLTPDAIREAFSSLRDGHDFDGLYAAARCRSESDWIVGLNATRYYTVRHGRIGGISDRVLWSIGRVQTPVLALIVERDDTIDQFRPQPFWELCTRYREVVFTYTGDRFDNQDKAQEQLDAVLNSPLTVTKVTGKNRKDLPPQLFDLTTLQREMNKLHGLSASDTLAAAQNLYEGKLITYPRTDSRYLSKDMQPRIPGIMAKLKQIRPQDIAPLDLNNLAFSKRIIDDSKVTDHHALIPTGVIPQSLQEHERLIYEAITTQFIAAFYPVCTKKITTVDAASNEIPFQAKGTQIIEPGWTILFQEKQNKTSQEDQTLPLFTKGETGEHEPYLREGKTKPPAHFTENSLLGAMEAAGKFVEDDELREALKERGIGTPATRAAIIETLLRRNYIRREKKTLCCTDMGRCLIALIRDPLLKSPEMTGEWEGRLKQIERNEHNAEDFMNGISSYISELVNTGANERIDSTRWGSCPLCKSEIIKGKRAYGCSDWKNGCPYVLEPEYKDMPLAPRQIQTLLQQHILPRSVRIGDAPRLLILSTQGVPMDLNLPSAEKQTSEKNRTQPKTNNQQDEKSEE